MSDIFRKYGYKFAKFHAQIKVMPPDACNPGMSNQNFYFFCILLQIMVNLLFKFSILWQVITPWL